MTITIPNSLSRRIKKVSNSTTKMRELYKLDKELHTLVCQVGSEVSLPMINAEEYRNTNILLDKLKKFI